MTKKEWDNRVKRVRDIMKSRGHKYTSTWKVTDRCWYDRFVKDGKATTIIISRLYFFCEDESIEWELENNIDEKELAW